MPRLSDHLFWEAICSTEGLQFSTLSDHRPGTSRVVTVHDDRVVIHGFDQSRRRNISRHDLVLVYEALWESEVLMLQAIGPETDVGKQRDQKLGNGSSLMGLLLRAFPNDFEKANQYQRVGLKIQSRL